MNQNPPVGEITFHSLEGAFDEYELFTRLSHGGMRLCAARYAAFVHARVAQAAGVVGSGTGNGKGMVR